jgi:serine/threonine protein kinase/Tol biopolymer transport system component
MPASESRWQRVNELFHAALARTPANRDAFLNAECGADSALRIEVQSLLDAHGTAASLTPAAVTAGTRLGDYEVTSFIAAGAMGQVYRASDTKLGRDVALKILPPAFTADPDRRARFEREARLLASLNHPNIATIYGFIDSDGVSGLALELVEGETLADRIARSRIPVDEALRIATQIAEALEAAHEQGIIHRDLKPANIKLTRDGAVKVLDFGLAKLVEPASALETLQPTLTNAGVVTGAHVLLGTPAYMSPEQARGESVDRRADMWAFGCVMYEMLTGRPPFEGKEIADVLARVIEREPDLTTLPAHTPPVIRRLLRRLLAKERSKRLDSAAAVRFDIEEAFTGPEEIAGADARNGVRGLLRLALAAVSALFGIAAIVAAALYYVETSRDAFSPVRFSIIPPDGWQLALQSAPPSGASATPLSVSPDGRLVAFVGRNMAGTHLVWLRSLATLDARPLEGTEGAASPFWSPDGGALGFFAGGKLKKIAIAGGPPITLADAPSERGGAWNQDGVIVFAPTAVSPLMKVSAAGGVPDAATTLGKGEAAHHRPVFLPDGRHFLYRVVTATSAAATPAQAPIQICVGSLESSERRVLLSPDSVNVVYALGHLLFLRGSTLFAQPFDTNRLLLTGDAFPIAEQIQAQGNSPAGVFSASNAGVLVYQTGTGDRTTELTWLDRAGKQLGTLGQPSQYADVELSEDAKQASVSLPDQSGKGRDVWMIDTVRNLRTRFTFDSADELTLIWSPERNRVAFNSRRNGHLDLYVKAASGSGVEELLLEDQSEKYPLSWSPDGRHILYVRAGGPTSNDLFVLPLSGDRKPIPFLNTQFAEAPGQFSPDGRWVTYSSNESGRSEVYVVPFPGGGGKWQISTGGSNPRWSRNGSEIVYLSLDNTLMAADVNGKRNGFEVGSVVPLFRTRIAPTRYEYDVSADGQRFLINMVPEQTTASPITVVVNWAPALQR